MRTFELLTVCDVLLYLWWLSFGNGLPTSLFRWLPFVAVGLVILHLFIEKARWQMGPVYLLVLLVLMTYPWCQSHNFRIRLTVIAIGWGFAIFLLVPATVAGGVLWPVFEFVPLSGPYPVGSTSVHLIDRGRRDPYSPDKMADRELMVQVWYPAETAGTVRERYRDGRRSDYKDSSLALVETRSFLDVPIAHAKSTYPLLLFTGPFNRFQNTFETEELASQGFIVVAIDHPYDSDLVVFPDGRRVTASKEACLLDFASDEALALSRPKVERRLAVRVADTRFVLDELQQWNGSDRTSRFFGRIDLSHIGMFGHSFGGAVTAEVCRVDPRVRAGVSMDGSMFGTSKTNGVPKPFFFMLDTSVRPTKAELESSNDKARREARELLGDFDDIDRSMNRYGGYFFQAPGLEHMNYSDYPLYSQWKPWTGAGAIDIRRAHELTNRITLAFFRRELLKDRSASVEATLRDFPGAILRKQ